MCPQCAMPHNYLQSPPYNSILIIFIQESPIRHSFQKLARGRNDRPDRKFRHIAISQLRDVDRNVLCL